MVSQWSTDISYAVNTQPVYIEQMQEYAVKTLKEKCPHIEDNELEIHYEEPVVLGDTQRQHIHVECGYCGDDNGY